MPCGKPCRQACAQQVDDQTEKECQTEHRRAEQYRHAQVELAGSAGVLIVGEQPRTHAVHGQIAEHQPHRSANQSQYEVFIQDLPYEYAARRSECLTHAQFADALLHTAVAQAAQIERRH